MNKQPRLPLRQLALLALAGTALCTVLVLVDVGRFGGNPLSLIQPGGRGPSVAVIGRDFPQTELPDGLGFDGQMFYATARQPMHLDEVSPDLDRPRYRLQRPLLPFLAWIVHPQGGGVGLIYALLLVGIVALVVGGVSIGSISLSLGGKTWPAAVFPLLPGCYICLRTSVADSLGVALALLAIALSLRARRGPAMLAAVAAILAKEIALVLLVGFWLWRRDRRTLGLIIAPLVAAAGWFVALRLLLPDGGGTVNEIVPPFSGLARSVSRWSQHRELSGMVVVIGSVLAAIVLLVRRGLRHPFAWAMLVQLAFISVLGVNVIANNLSGTRSTIALGACVLLAIAVPIQPAPLRSTQHEKEAISN